MSAAEVIKGPPREMPAAPPWLDLPPNYQLQDWMQWQRGLYVARRLRHQPQLIAQAVERLERSHRLPGAHAEWLTLLRESDVDSICAILEAPTDEGQRLRSSSPFSGEPFITLKENEDVRKRAYPW